MHGYIRRMRTAPCVTIPRILNVTNIARGWVVNLFLDAQTFLKLFLGTSSKYHQDFFLFFS